MPTIYALTGPLRNRRVSLPAHTVQVDGSIDAALIPDDAAALIVEESDQLRSLYGLPATIKVFAARKCSQLQDLRGLPEGVEKVYFESCISVLSVHGLPEGVIDVDFSSCINLLSVRGLPSSVTQANFTDCRALTSTDGLPPAMTHVDFSLCTGLTSTGVLPSALRRVCFDYCRNLRIINRLPSGLRWAHFEGCTLLNRMQFGLYNVVYGWTVPDGAAEVGKVYQSGVLNALLGGAVAEGGRRLPRLGQDVTSIIASMTTAGFLPGSRVLDNHGVRSYLYKTNRLVPMAVQNDDATMVREDLQTFMNDLYTDVPYSMPTILAFLEAQILILRGGERIDTITGDVTHTYAANAYAIAHLRLVIDRVRADPTRVSTLRMLEWVISTFDPANMQE